MAGKVKVSKEQKDGFLRALVETSSPALAAREAGGAKADFLALREDDPEFAAAWDAALDEAAEILEAEARRRAVDGVETPVWYGGEQRGTTRKRSDALLTCLLKRQKPAGAPEGDDGGSVMDELEKKIAEARKRVREKSQQD